MYKLVLLPLAKQDIKEAANWYEKKQKGLGKRFIAYVRQKANFVKKQPLTVAVRYNKVHTAVLEVFPFMIHYIIDEDKKALVIIAVLHTSRSPKLWEKRSRDF